MKGFPLGYDEFLAYKFEMAEIFEFEKFTQWYQKHHWVKNVSLGSPFFNAWKIEIRNVWTWDMHRLSCHIRPRLDTFIYIMPPPPHYWLYIKPTLPHLVIANIIALLRTNCSLFWFACTRIFMHAEMHAGTHMHLFSIHALMHTSIHSCTFELV